MRPIRHRVREVIEMYTSVVDALMVDGAEALLHAIDERNRSYDELYGLGAEYTHALLALSSAGIVGLSEEHVYLSPLGEHVMGALDALDDEPQSSGGDGQ